MCKRSRVKLNPKKICFISCVNNSKEYDMALVYIHSLKIPDGYEIETIAIEHATSLASGYNQAMNQSDAKYKVYIHQDTFLLNENFLYDVISLFEKYPKLGMLGVLGAKAIPNLNEGWPPSDTYGTLYHTMRGKGMDFLPFNTVEQDFEKVLSIDGILMATQYDLRWQEELFNGWHFYDISQSLEFIKAGYDVGVPRQKNPWCFHDCGVLNTAGYEENRNIFLEHYDVDTLAKEYLLDQPSPKERYIELLKKTLLFEMWQEHEEDLFSNLMGHGKNVDPLKHQNGEIWPKTAHSMIGRMRMNNLQMCMETILEEQIEGDFIETGVWRGGACIFMQGFLQAEGIHNRKIWVADSFEGLPPPNEIKYPKDKGDQLHTFSYLAVSLEEVQRNFQKYDLLDTNVHFLKGWFKDTLPTAPIKKLSLLRLDGDLYESTMDSLNNLYHKVSKNGFIIIDDYILPTCQAAVTDFREEHHIQAPLIPIDNHSVYWRKP